MTVIHNINAGKLLSEFNNKDLEIHRLRTGLAQAQKRAEEYQNKYLAAKAKLIELGIITVPGHGNTL